MRPRFNTLVWAVVILASAFGLYLVKYRVQEIQEELTLTTQKLEEERESMHVVAAEWSYLNRPQRLEQLAQKHLDLVPVDGAKIVDLAAIPHPEREVAVASEAGR